MSQYFDFFTCTETQLDEWSAALEKNDEEGLAINEKKMLMFIGLKNIGFDFFGVLAGCGEKKPDDPFEFVSAFEFKETKLTNEIEGPWVVQFKKDVVKLISELTVDDELVSRWLNKMKEYSDNVNDDLDEEDKKYYKETAKSLVKLSKLSLKHKLPVYCCFYG